jgi:mannosyl-oligosaccharide glucosidase
VETGAHSSAFAERIGKTHYLGLRLQPGTIWQAKEPILQNIIKQAQETLQDYKDPAIGAPDPSFVLQLTNDVYTSSNLYAVQKLFDGEFSFDVFFESGSSKQKLSCKLTRANIEMLLTVERILSSGDPRRSHPCPCRILP